MPPAAPRSPCFLTVNMLINRPGFGPDRTRTRTVASLVLTALLLLPGPLSANPARADPPPFGIGDWVVTGRRTREEAA
ncbi:MAG: hypothetical protein QW379_07030 [Thermoplasmata archaeon]